MIETPELIALIRTWGLGMLAPLALLEGPMVSVVAGYAVSLGALPLRGVLITLVLADLAGDAILYAIGRFGAGRIPPHWLRRAGVTRRHLARLTLGFRSHDLRLLMLGKLTHAAGFAVLLAAGAARMPFARFLLANLVLTIPKSAAFVMIGWVFGLALPLGDGWLWPALTLAAIALFLLSILPLFRPRRATP